LIAQYCAISGDAEGIGGATPTARPSDVSGGGCIIGGLGSAEGTISGAR
jgi:hypothetical protein